MNLNEALNVAEQVKNRYQAFEKIAEVLEVARNQEALIEQRKAQLSKLEATIANAQEETKTLDAKIKDARSSVAVAEREAAEAVKHFDNETAKNLDRLRALAAEQVSKLEEEQKAREASFKEAMLKMADEEAQKRGQIAALHTQINDLKETARKVLG